DSHDFPVVEARQRNIDRVLPDVGNRDLAAFVQEIADNPDPDPVGAAGDESRSARAVFHRPAPAAAAMEWIGLSGPLSPPGESASILSRSPNSHRPSPLRSWTD